MIRGSCGQGDEGIGSSFCWLSVTRVFAGLELEPLGVALRVGFSEMDGVWWDSFRRFKPLGISGGEFSSDQNPKFGLDRTLRCVLSARSFEDVDRRVSVSARGGRGVKKRLNLRGVTEGLRFSLLYKELGGPWGEELSTLDCLGSWSSFACCEGILTIESVPLRPVGWQLNCAELQMLSFPGVYRLKVSKVRFFLSSLSRKSISISIAYRVRVDGPIASDPCATTVILASKFGPPNKFIAKKERLEVDHNCNRCSTTQLPQPWVSRKSMVKVVLTSGTNWPRRKDTVPELLSS